MSFIDFVQLSLSAIIMLTGLFIALVGSGSEVFKVKVASATWRKFYLTVGIPLFIVGASLSVLLVYREVFNVTLPPPNWTYIFYISAKVIQYGFITIAALSPFYLIWFFVQEKLYSLEGFFVNSTVKEANIRLEHRGGRPFHCIAKLNEIKSISSSGTKTKLELNKINPNGYPFEWHDGSWFSQISKVNPRVVKIIGFTGRGYGNEELKLMLHGGRKELDIKNYEISISLYRISRKSHILMKTIKCELVVRNKELSWKVVK